MIPLISEQCKASFAELIAKLLSISPYIDKVDVKYNEFSAESTTIICEALKSSPSIKRIKDLKMSQSVNFIENAACEHFADFLAEAHELAELTCVQFIGEGYRKVVATIECADDGE